MIKIRLDLNALGSGALGGLGVLLLVLPLMAQVLSFAGVPSSAMLLNSGACPSGYTELTAAQGRFLVGMPSGGTASGTLGTAIADLADASFTPAGTNSSITPIFTGTLLAGHAHRTINQAGPRISAENFGQSTAQIASHLPTVVADATSSNSDLTSSDSAGTPAGTNSAVQPVFTGTANPTMRSTLTPYLQLRVCQKS